ncbi:unnamed protein product [Adineta steineri]|uniref:Uncharacterized protein n=1 Tax=Adineta steineri TaxID=433720 RepID=A0A814R9W6_9BILA|nr:unnamed protein product [Adineta steineri]
MELYKTTSFNWDYSTFWIISLSRYLNDNPLFEERSLEVKLVRQLMVDIEEQNKEAFLKHFDDTPLTTLRADRIFRSMIDDIGKKINGDVDLK